jgi:hypothetical protein
MKLEIIEARLKAIIKSIDSATPAERQKDISRSTVDACLEIERAIREGYPEIDEQIPSLSGFRPFLDLRIAIEQVLVVIEMMKE